MWGGGRIYSGEGGRSSRKGLVFGAGGRDLEETGRDVCMEWGIFELRRRWDGALRENAGKVLGRGSGKRDLHRMGDF